MSTELGRRRSPAPGVIWGLAGFVIGGALVALVGALLLGGPKPRLELGPSHHAVLLNGGQAFFGRLEERGPETLVLTDAFYVQSQRSADGKETTNRLIRRGAELHSPSRMYIPMRSVQFIEPVAPDSQIGKLIAEAKR
jgi:hypothetical protein